MSPKVARIFALFQQDRSGGANDCRHPGILTGPEAADLTTSLHLAPKLVRVPIIAGAPVSLCQGLSGPPAQHCEYFLDEVQKTYPPNGVESSSVSHLDDQLGKLLSVLAGWRPHSDQQSRLLFRVRDDAPNGGEQRLELDRFDIELVAARGNGLLALAR